MNVNPVAYLIGKSGLSVREFERKFGFSHSAMIQQTGGVYETILPRVLEALDQLADEKGFDLDEVIEEAYQVGTLGEAYRAWQVDARRSWAADVQLPAARLLPVNGPNPPASVFAVTVAGNPTSFSKSLKVAQAPVMKWVTGQIRGIPDSIEKALLDVDYEYIDELRAAQEEWFDNARI